MEYIQNHSLLLFLDTKPLLTPARQLNTLNKYWRLLGRKTFTRQEKLHAAVYICPQDMFSVWIRFPSLSLSPALQTLLHFESQNRPTEEEFYREQPRWRNVSFQNGATKTRFPPNWTGFGSTVHGVLGGSPSSSACHIYRKKRSGGGAHQLDSLIITTFRRRLLQRQYIYTTPELQRIQAGQRWEKNRTSQ